VPVHVALLDLPQMLSEIVKDILGQATDVTVADTPAADTDVVIVGAQEDELPVAALVQLERQPKSKVLTINRHGRNAYLFELRPCRTALGEVSAEVLLAAVGARADA